MTITRRLILAFTLLAASEACATIASHALRGALSPKRGQRIVIDKYTVGLLPTKWEPGVLRAGVGRADITPPPGIPTGGHGPAGSIARGYWTRLYARAYFFADASGNTLTLVSCELFALPGGLSSKVARDVALKWGRRGIVLSPASIVIAATHTHQSPGNFMTAASYNSFASTYPGFDPELFAFLVERISHAVDVAISDALVGGAATLSVRSAKTARWLQLNRSPRTFLLNHDAQALMDDLNPRTAGDPPCSPQTEQGEAATDWDLMGCPRLRAVDRTVTLLDIERDHHLIGALVFFSIHPTVLDHHAPVFSSDAMGLAMIELEHRWSYNQTMPVVGFFNGAEGDVVPRRAWRDVRATRETSLLLAAEMDVLHGHEGIAVAVNRIEAARILSGSSEQCCYSEPAQLAKAPLVGVAAPGGAEDDRTAAYALGFREGVRDIASGGQGGKFPALDSQLLRAVQLTNILAPAWTFPDRLPVTLARLGTFTIGALPAEISTATGATVRAAVGEPHGMFGLIGLADEYTGYAASPDEYAGQDYMGASTIWGPYEGPFFACTLRRLKAALRPTSEHVEVLARSFDPGIAFTKETPFVNFGPEAVGERRSAADEELDHILLTTDHVPARDLPYLEWNEIAADLQQVFGFTSRRRVRVRRVSDGAVYEDDQGHFVTLELAKPTKGIYPWAAIWVTPLWSQDDLVGEYRFEVDVPVAIGIQRTEIKTIVSCPFLVRGRSRGEGGPAVKGPRSRHPISSTETGCRGE